MSSWPVVFLLVVCTGAALGGSRFGSLPTAAKTKDWWTNATFYQIDPAFFKDSNQDCKGDLRGIYDKVSYLKDMKMAGVVLSPIHREDNFIEINPDLGNMDNFKAMVKSLNESNINVILEFDFSSTAKEHPWFIQNPDYYFRIPIGDVNNWLATSGESAWYKNESYYYLSFFDERPQLNFSNPDVDKEIKSIMTFWMDLGVNGFKLRNSSYLFPSKGLENENESLPCPTPTQNRYLCVNHTYTINTNETYSLFKTWSSHINTTTTNTTNYVQRILIAVPFVQSENDAQKFVENGANLVLGTVLSDGKDFAESASLEKWIRVVTTPAWTTWYNRSEILNPMNVDAYNMITALMPGAYFQLYGDEIGMASYDIGFKWDVTQFAGFSNCSNFTDPSKIVNPDYYDSNLETEKSASLSHYVVLERLKKIRPDLTKFDFKFINFTVDHVYAFSRMTTEKIYVVLFNMDIIEHKIDLSTVGIKNGHLKVDVPSVSSAYKIGDSLDVKNITLRPISSLVLTDGSLVPDNSAAVRHTTAFALLILSLARFLF